MTQVIPLNRQPRVLTPTLALRLHRVNTISRWLRDRGVRVLATDFLSGGRTCIVVDRNTHALPPGSGDISIIIRRPQ
jgi:hypothetical protein